MKAVGWVGMTLAGSAEQIAVIGVRKALKIGRASSEGTPA